MYLDPSIRAVKSGARKDSSYKMSSYKSSSYKSGGYKSSGYKYYGGGGGSRLPVWVIVVIVVSVLWACLYLILFFHFFRKYYLRADPLKRRRLGSALGRAAWKALLCATLIQPLIWAIRKLTERFRAGRGGKNVGGTFYRKIEEGEEKGQEQGVRDINSRNGEPADVTAPAETHKEPLMSPMMISKGENLR
ncbi:hypothetical protein F5B19DRAFT_458474 [Rostrohypoxylon terebratum]|nr:hypothetical protein F5B19DRAFT_458474 [Rostrohypoxylon terebratum]